MFAKLCIVEEEADETIYWLELLSSLNAVPSSRADPLIREADEILRMVVASKRTLQRRRSAEPPH
jgi:four helix bundle protein